MVGVVEEGVSEGAEVLSSCFMYSGISCLQAPNSQFGPLRGTEVPSGQSITSCGHMSTTTSGSFFRRYKTPPSVRAATRITATAIRVCFMFKSIAVMRGR